MFAPDVLRNVRAATSWQFTETETETDTHRNSTETP